MEPKRPSDFLGGILREARTVASRSDVQKALANAVGPDLESHCRVAGMTAGRLTIEVDSAPLFAELQGFRREEIRTALNDQIKQKVAEITFRLGVARHG